MARELMLLRHGKSAWNTGAETDFDRPLKSRGRKAARRMARWVIEHEVVPDRVVSSPAVRARQTVKRFCKQLGYPAAAIRFDDRIYEAGVDALLQVLGEHGDAGERLLLVGHNPGLQDLVVFLCAGRVDLPPGGNLMPTAALARLSMPADWSGLGSGDAAVLEVVRPRELARD